MTTLEKLDMVCQTVGLSRSAFSEKLIKSKSLFGNLRRGQAKGLSEIGLNRLFNVFQVSPNWWFLGEGEMFLPPKDGTSPDAGAALCAAEEKMQAMERILEESSRTTKEMQKAMEALKKDLYARPRDVPNGLF